VRVRPSRSRARNANGIDDGGSFEANIAEPSGCRDSNERGYSSVGAPSGWT
jgi:hypothetical protein